MCARLTLNKHLFLPLSSQRSVIILALDFQQLTTACDFRGTFICLLCANHLHALHNNVDLLNQRAKAKCCLWLCDSVLCVGFQAGKSVRLPQPWRSGESAMTTLVWCSTGRPPPGVPALRKPPWISMEPASGMGPLPVQWAFRSAKSAARRRTLDPS